MLNSISRYARVVRVNLALIVSCFVLVSLSLSQAFAADEFLDPADAFKFSAEQRTGGIDVHFKIADGYYMYREQFAFAVRNGSATLGAAQLPDGKIKFDQTFQKDVETYRHDLTIHVPVEQAAGPFDLVVTSQGCADAGICYPPAEHSYRVSGAALQGASATTGESGAISAVTGDMPWYERATSLDYAQSLLQGGGFLGIIGLYFLAGLVLSLLPCSYPMIPILSAIIIGEGARVTRARGFSLSLSYVLGMALVYTALGVAAALVGQSLGAWLQNPWVLGAFGVLLSAFALLLMGGIDISLPARWQDSVSRTSARHSGGKFFAVAVMGALSALVVGACMTAPLFAVLAFIAHTGNALLGGAALFAMGVGLGVPLLLIGLGAGALLPRAGAWMNSVKVFFGVMLLAAALWIVWPVLDETALMLLGVLWLLVVAASLGFGLPFTAGSSIWRRLARGFSVLCLIWAGFMLAGLAGGSGDPLRPLAVFVPLAGASTAPAPGVKAHGALAFAPVRSSAELDQVLAASPKRVMLDFYADWCVSCKEMEKFTFSDPRVVAALKSFDLVQADVTANSPDDQALLKRFKLFGPPGIIFFDQDGKEVMRVVGYESADKFLRSLERVTN
ncbi:protein-disulfide reductase DsbD [Paraburkholderia bonniea]|uniref:protein-disulfide reductase DsbD n=1 Tax=Paraburkholderia bonniea TaxID=2152891 RepID=UPI0012915E3D|nr:protein-disulfide reductase DsbD [Paraburkholderia bonniea]